MCYFAEQIVHGRRGNTHSLQYLSFVEYRRFCVRLVGFSHILVIEVVTPTWPTSPQLGIVFDIIHPETVCYYQGMQPRNPDIHETSGVQHVHNPSDDMQLFGWDIEPSVEGCYQLSPYLLARIWGDEGEGLKKSLRMPISFARSKPRSCSRYLLIFGRPSWFWRKNTKNIVVFRHGWGPIVMWIHLFVRTAFIFILDSVEVRIVGSDRRSNRP